MIRTVVGYGHVVVDYDNTFPEGAVQIAVSTVVGDAPNYWGLLDKKELSDLITVLQYYQAIGEGKIKE